MDKNNIKKQLVERFVNEATPGIEVTKAVLSKSKAFNDEGLKDIEKKLKDADKGQKKSASKTKDMPQNKFNYNSDSEKEYHQEMELMNGQEMIEYDRDPNQLFKDRAKKAIEGHPSMGNSPDYANVVPEQMGFTGPTFGKKLVQAIKNSNKKRQDAVKGIISFGDDIETVPDNYAPMSSFSALNESSKFDGKIPDLFYPYSQSIIKIVNDVNDPTTEANYIEKSKAVIKALHNKLGDNPNFESSIPQLYRYIADLAGISAPYKKQANESDDAANRNIKYGNPYGTEDEYEAKEKLKKLANDSDENKNNNKPQIKEGMKRLKFKQEFKGVGNALKLIPESYKVDNKVFEMTDGVESYRMRWEGTLTEGKAIVLMASDKTMVNEDMQKMKHLMGYKSQETLGTVKGKARIDENKIFSDIWKKSVILIEGEDIESQKAPEKKTDEKVAQSGEAKKHVEGSVSTDKGTKAPAAKTGSADSLEKVKTQAPEAKKAVQGSVEKKVGIGLGDQAEGEGNWDEVSVPQAAEAKKHVHMREGIKLGESYFAPMDEAWMEEMMHGGMEEGMYEEGMYEEGMYEEGMYEEDEYVDYTMGRKDKDQLPNPPREIKIDMDEELDSLYEIEESDNMDEMDSLMGNEDDE
jgi:hypothetical protein